MVKLPSRAYADVRTVGIPRSLLYYRYGVMWTTFFEALGRTVVVSPETDRALVEAGEHVSVDECCLASKAYLGHVERLIGACDALFVPCYASGNPRAGFCTKFQSATDLVANTFRDRLAPAGTPQPQPAPGTAPTGEPSPARTRLLPLLVEDASNRKKTRAAFLELALELGATPPTARAAWKRAVRAQLDADDARAAAQAETLRLLDEYRGIVAQDETGREQKPLAILLVAHPYLAHDRYLCGTIVDALENRGVTVLYADETDHARTFKASFDFSDTLPWAINRELIGAILTLQDRIDGIVLVSAFPCGPDSMTDDAIMRCIQGTPILNLMIDAQSGTAGMETRVESFVDILRFQQKGGYVHG